MRKTIVTKNPLEDFDSLLRSNKIILIVNNDCRQISLLANLPKNNENTGYG
ncbi:MAG TPA: hypothetical protein VFK40_05440 [Nitrososphaeraceae archaeon]|nr:hypothetical protein [Nitrososphaeraceae archaeon]